MTRTPEAANMPPEVNVVRGDLTIPESLDECLDGVDTAFLLWTTHGSAAPGAVETIARHGCRLVFLSSPHRTPHPFFQQRNPMAVMFAEIERLIEASGIPVTYLRPGMFASNSLSWWLPQIRSGDVVRWPFAEAATAPIHEKDIAAVAVRCLLDARHDGSDYVLTGPESLTQRQQVETIGEVLDRPLRMDEISPDKARLELGFPTPVMNMLLNAWAAAVGQPAFLTDIVAEVTGKQPLTFRDWVVDHTGEFQSSV
jgi:uncharacterized protein YbjT (DUF2867 family)